MCIKLYIRSWLRHGISYHDEFIPRRPRASHFLRQPSGGHRFFLRWRSAGDPESVPVVFQRRPTDAAQAAYRHVCVALQKQQVWHAVLPLGASRQLLWPKSGSAGEEFAPHVPMVPGFAGEGCSRNARPVEAERAAALPVSARDLRGAPAGQPDDPRRPQRHRTDRWVAVSAQAEVSPWASCGRRPVGVRRLRHVDHTGRGLHGAGAGPTSGHTHADHSEDSPARIDDPQRPVGCLQAAARWPELHLRHHEPQPELRWPGDWRPHTSDRILLGQSKADIQVDEGSVVCPVAQLPGWADVAWPTRAWCRRCIRQHLSPHPRQLPGVGQPPIPKRPFSGPTTYVQREFTFCALAGDDNYKK